MSALSNYTGTSFLTPKLSNETVKSLVNVVVWELFDMIKDESIKLSIWKIPISIKVSKLSIIVEKLVGPRNHFH